MKMVMQKLRGAIGAGQALLDHFNLLKPLIEKMVASEAIADVVVSETVGAGPALLTPGARVRRHGAVGGVVECLGMH